MADGRALVAAGIWFYRRALKPFYPRDCLFGVTCSEHVLRAGRTGGLAAAWRAFAERHATCRAGYSIGSHEGLPCVVTERGVVLPFDALSVAVQSEVRVAMEEAKHRA